MGRGGDEGCVPSLMTAAVEREVFNSYSVLSSLMCRPWGIRLKRERNGVSVADKPLWLPASSSVRSLLALFSKSSEPLCMVPLPCTPLWGTLPCTPFGGAKKN